MQEGFETSSNRTLNRIFYVVLTFVLLFFSRSCLNKDRFLSGCKSFCNNSKRQFNGYKEKNIFSAECICGAIIKERREITNERH